ncbi:MAG: hypothetical protein HUU20_00740 [Pirellulales bacterium]|nr:hypothetical protein [Pirellulales bacterium]
MLKQCSALAVVLCRLPGGAGDVLAMRLRELIYAPLLALTVVASNTDSAPGQERRWVVVDAPRVISAKDVTPSSYADDSRVLELILSPSPRFTEGLKKATILRLNYRIETAFPVVDFLPSTTLSTVFATDIDVVTSVSEFNGRISYVVSPRSGGAMAESRSRESNVTYRLLPPLDTLIESGFDNKGRGAFFAFHADNRTTLAGRKDIAILLRVPKEFRGDYVTLRVSGEMENDEAPCCVVRMVKHGFQDEFDVAFYRDGAPDSADLRKRADGFANNPSLAAAAAKLEAAIRRREQGTGWSFGPSKELVDGVNNAKAEFDSLQEKARTEFRRANNTDSVQ